MPNMECMISIPIAVYNELFRFQLDLFWFAHKKIYGHSANKKTLAVIIRRNDSFDTKLINYEWKINIPKNICESYFDFDNTTSENGFLLPLNIQIGLLQTIEKLRDDQVIELIDCDMFHIKKHPKLNINHDEMYVSDIYETWHLFSLTKNKFIIEKYCKTNKFYNGGFVPIIATVKTFKKLLFDWIYFHKDIVSSYSEEKQIKWWAGMFSLQAACEVNKIKMIAQNFCYLPNIHEISKMHYIAHYSCDKFFDKKKFPNINFNHFPKTPYYNLIKEWAEKFGLYKKTIKFT